jgi:predicted dehydrogenase
VDLFSTDDGQHPQQLTTAVRTREADAVTSEQRAFVEGVVRGEAPEQNSVAQGLAVQRLVDASYTAGERGEGTAIDGVPAWRTTAD